MLLTIIKMPNVYSPDVDTRAVMSTNRLVQVPGMRYDGNLILGTQTVHFPDCLYKAFYLSPGSQSVVEVVYEKVDRDYLCLYTKVIGEVVDVVASRVGVEHYVRHGRERALLTLGELIAEVYFNRKDTTIPKEFRDILPVVYTDEDVSDFVYQLLGTFSGDHPIPYKGSLVDRLYTSYPHILNALVTGQFTKPPENYLVQNHPYIQIKPEIWSLADSSMFANEVANGRVIINATAFHDVVRQLVCMRPGALRVTFPLSIESGGINTFRVNTKLDDPYIWALPMNNRSLKQIDIDLDRIFVTCFHIYCRLNGLDPSMFDQMITNSAITIEKNICDEVMISVHDLVNDKFVQYYSYFPITVLGTKAIGYTL